MTPPNPASGGARESAGSTAAATDGTEPRAGPGAHLTLHYRLRLASRDADVISTFGGKPATLQLGIGQLAEPLERCLIGLADGDKRSFRLAEGEAFGPRNPELVQRLARATFDAHITADMQYEPGDLVELPAPDGGRYAGVVKEINEHYVLFDFNHPLAGQSLDFDVEILAVL